MKEVPAVVWVCLTVVFLGVITAFVVLSLQGANSEDFSRFINSVLNVGGLLVGGGAAAFSASAAVSAKKAQTQTNGDMDKRIEKIVTTALEKNNGQGN